MKDKKTVLPMNCFDETWLCTDSRIERNCYHVILHIEGEIDPAKLNQAFLSAINRHPALRTILRRRVLRHYREVQDDLDGQVLNVTDLTSSGDAGGLVSEEMDAQYDKRLSEWINRPFNLKKERPLRLLLLKKSQAKSSLILSFHHSCADALRALRFINEVIGWYNHGGPDDPSLPEDRPACHRRDELLQWIQSSKARVRYYYPKIMSRLFYRFVISLPNPSSRIFHDRSGSSGEVAFLHRAIGPVELAEMDGKSRSVKATVNDLLLAACFRTIEKWNRLHGKASRKISIMVPVDVGRKASQHIISNQLSYVSPATTPEDRADSVALLHKVSRKSARVIRNGNAFAMIYFTYFLACLSFAIMKIVGWLFVATRVYIDAFLLTNAGIIRLGEKGIEGVPRIGNARIVDISGVTPVLTPWGMSLVTAVYNGNLNMALTYRPSRFSPKKAEQFFDLYLQEIRDYLVALESA
jgi:NRPS condensation-like uncharacterized protein